MNIENTYKPFNYSSSSVYVIPFIIPSFGVFKLEDKLPLQIKILTGIYITSSVQDKRQVIGFITLNFNEGILKPIQLPLWNTSTIRHHSRPIPLNETIKTNSMMQGYCISQIATKTAFSLKIYLHYLK